ncbi:uncharacterized protein LOC5521723 isoform X2 [Nematostella vectensis]|uniref:uncharacterized protein LOC5521723 isoform X2 n=1 Tax=Nematostella vectensis TaxID=45351 RepID=UPI002076F8CC|nr:uncharacterized protein LOC5521723 isoform X2 [Nematostella vectensis]
MARISNRIRLEDNDVFPATTEGPANVFSSTPFLLVKPRWMSDDEAHVCPLCSQKFTQIRRKHHCRQCGRVLCNKCCNEKVPLPQMGFEDPERICDYCLPVTSLITKSRSLQMSFKLEAAQGLTEMCKEPAQLKKVIEMGGVQTMIFLSQSSHDDVKLWVSEGLRILSTHDPLHPMLAKCGAIKALCSILSSASESQEQTLINGISALMIFCKSEELKAQALADGALYPVLSQCTLTLLLLPLALADGALYPVLSQCTLTLLLLPLALADGALYPVLSQCTLTLLLIPLALADGVLYPVLSQCTLTLLLLPLALADGALYPVLSQCTLTLLLKPLVLADGVLYPVLSQCTLTLLLIPLALADGVLYPVLSQCTLTLLSLPLALADGALCCPSVP